MLNDFFDRKVHKQVGHYRFTYMLSHVGPKYDDLVNIYCHAHWDNPHPSYRREDIWEAGTLQPMEYPEMLYLPPNLPGSTPKKPDMVKEPTEGNLPRLEEMRHHELVDLVKKLLAERSSKPTPLTDSSKDATVAGHVSMNQESFVQSSQAILHLASYNFSLEYQKGKDNTVADFLSQMNERLPEEEVQEYLNKIPYPGVKAVLDNAITPIKEHAEQGVRPTPDCQGDCQEETVGARPVRLATTNVTDWKQEQKEDPVLYQVAKHLRAPHETFKAALHKVLDKKATAAYVKAKEQLLIEMASCTIRPSRDRLMRSCSNL